MAREEISPPVPELSTAHSMAEYFRDTLQSAFQRRGVSRGEDTEYYLVNLLETYSHAAVDQQALAMRFFQALSATRSERAALLRDLADKSLFVSGFFPDSLGRRLVDVDYYISMGENAYAMLARMAQQGATRGGAREAPIYGELSERFKTFVDVLNDVSAQSRVRSNRDLLTLYERWVRTGSSWVARRLEALGVKMPAGATEDAKKIATHPSREDLQ